jgi:peptidoglycan/xylan/chitin deacetylase (PgdA/CDA1 family)
MVHAQSGKTAMPIVKQTTVRIPILMYHYVEVVRNPKDTMRVRMAITPMQFEQQLQTLSGAHIETHFVSDVPSMLAGTLSAKHTVMLTFDDGYRDFYTDVLPLLKKYHAKATFYVVNHFIGKNDYVTETQLEEIASSGLVEIGAHTLDHKDLRTLSLAKATKQIAESKTDLEQRIHSPVTMFAYPSGKFNNQLVKIVRSAGFTTAVTTKSGTSQAKGGMLVLRRLRPGASKGKGLLHLIQG